MSKRKIKKKGISIQKSIVVAVCSIILWGIFSVTDSLNTVRLPSSEFPAELYSNQTRDDLGSTFSKAMEEAKDSIVLLIYALTDPQIINALKKRANEGVSVTVIHDPEASPYLARKLGAKIKTIKAQSKGLMHQKILVVDGKQTWLGSANMTTDSLKKHGNLVTAIEAETIAQRVLSRADTMSNKKRGEPFLHEAFQIGPQTLELWFLPDDPLASKRIIDLIDSAKKTLRIAMFTWTRQDFAKAVIAAHRRGVDVQVVMDQYSAKGAGAAVTLMLCHSGVPIALSSGSALLHHKMAVIDDQYLINGSANWTKAAFGKNDDCFIVLYDLTDEQQKFLNRLWDVIAIESIPQEAENMDLENAA